MTAESHCSPTGISLEDTGYGYTLSVINGKYKMIILYWLALYKPVLRFNELQRCIGTISYKTLSSTLKGPPSAASSSGRGDRRTPRTAGHRTGEGSRSRGSAPSRAPAYRPLARGSRPTPSRLSCRRRWRRRMRRSGTRAEGRASDRS